MTDTPIDDLDVEDLLDIERIKQLKYAYLRCLDQKDWDGLADLFTDDATAAYSGGRYTCAGRDEIVDFITRNMDRDQFHSSHRVHHPEIDVDGDQASGVWAMEDTVLDAEWNVLVFGAAFYEDRYRRTADADGRIAWRIAHTGYRRSFEAMLPIRPDSGFQLTASWWATGGRSSLPVR